MITKEEALEAMEKAIEILRATFTEDDGYAMGSRLGVLKEYITQSETSVSSVEDYPIVTDGWGTKIK